MLRLLLADVLAGLLTPALRGGPAASLPDGFDRCGERHLVIDGLPPLGQVPAHEHGEGLVHARDLGQGERLRREDRRS